MEIKCGLVVSDWEQEIVVCSCGCSTHSCIWLRTGASGDLLWTLVIVTGREQELVCALVGISNCRPFCSCPILY